MVEHGNGPLISVLINNYNYAQFLADCIQSVLSQNYDDVEIIVVDDGSTDNSRDVIASYGDRIIPVLKANGGQASSFNAAFAAASGDILCMLDADDAFLPGKLKRIASIYADSDVDWCFDHVTTTEGDVAQSEIQVTRIDKRDISKKRGFPSLPVPTSGLTFRRRTLSKILPMPLAKGVVLSDNYLKFAASHLGSGVIIETPLTFQRLHGANRYTGIEKSSLLRSRIMVETGLQLARRYEGLKTKGLVEIAGGLSKGGIPCWENLVRNPSLHARWHIRPVWRRENCSSCHIEALAEALIERRGANGMSSEQVSGANELHIVVAALTYRRPEGVSKLLDVLTRQVKTSARPYKLTVLIIDNDAKGSGQSAVEAYANTGAYDLIYKIESEPGIPFARNRALDEAPSNTDLFCFLDDDEWPVDGWLDAMLTVREKTGADCVYGPVEPVYPKAPPKYFVKSRVFERKKNGDCERIYYAASNNVMFDYKIIRSWNHRFEEKMRFTGGTDYLFFNQAVRRGMKIFWADSALVYDIIPASRMTWKWVLQRQYRLGNTFAVSEILHGDRNRRIKRLLYGTARVGLGVIMLPTISVSPKWGMRALTHILRGAGMISGILGHSYQEYKPRVNGEIS